MRHGLHRVVLCSQRNILFSQVILKALLFSLKWSLRLHKRSLCFKTLGYFIVAYVCLHWQFVKYRYKGIRSSLSAFVVPSLFLHPSLLNSSLAHQASFVARPFLEDIGIRNCDTSIRPCIFLPFLGFKLSDNSVSM